MKNILDKIFQEETTQISKRDKKIDELRFLEKNLRRREVRYYLSNKAGVNATIVDSFNNYQPVLEMKLHEHNLGQISHVVQNFNREFEQYNKELFDYLTNEYKRTTRGFIVIL